MFNTPSDNSYPVAHFLASVNDLIEHALRDVDGGDMVVVTIQKQVNQNDKPNGISFRRKDTLSGKVIWSVFESVAVEFWIQCSGHVSRNRAYGQDALGYGKGAIKSRGRPLSVMAHLKQSIVEVKTDENCLSHVLIVAIARVDNDPKYKACRQGLKIRHVVRTLLETTRIYLSNGSGIPEIVGF